MQAFSLTDGVVDFPGRCEGEVSPSDKPVTRPGEHEAQQPREEVGHGRQEAVLVEVEKTHIY